MNCYRGKSFCAVKDCTNTKCDRHRSHVPDDTGGLLVSQTDFSTTCEHYRGGEREDNNQSVVSDRSHPTDEERSMFS